MEYSERYFKEVQEIAKTIDTDIIENMVLIIESVKKTTVEYFFLGLVAAQQIVPMLLMILER